MDNTEKKYNVIIHTTRGNLHSVVDVPVEVAENEDCLADFMYEYASIVAEDEDCLAEFMDEYASIVAQENEGVACEEVEYEEVV